MRVIGRKAETEELLRCERSGKSELVCVYGRRRVGKTFLIEQTFSNCFAFRATGVESGNMKIQLKSFNQRLLEYGAAEKATPTDWFEAFSRLYKLLTREETLRSPHGKRIVFFDEFPWFATARSDFLMAFGEFWNRCGTIDGDFLFIICGSATSWIIGNILENTGSLYNRVTCQIFLSPFTLWESEQFFRDREFGWSRNQIAECQMVFGGLPYFLDLLSPHESLSWNIDYLCFQPHALLRNESMKLLEATLRKSPVYDQILRLLSSKRYGMRKVECFEQLSIPKGTFSRAVDDLQKCGYIEEHKEPHGKNHPLWLYLSDPFLLFHYTFLSADAPKDIEHFHDFRHDNGSYANWRGHAFEMLCLYHIRLIKASLGIAGVRTVHFPWVGRDAEGGAQIDLVIERDDGITDICEIKYTDQPFAISADYEQKLLKKIRLFQSETGTRQSLKLVFISAMGLKGTTHTEYVSRVLTLDDLFDGFYR